MTPEFTAEFWAALDQLVASSPIVIDRPRGSRHPRLPQIIYPLDYGYLEGTTTVDGGGLDVWVGTRSPKTLDALLCTVDLEKRDVELKLLLGCQDHEKSLLLDFHNQGTMHAVLVER